MTEQEFEAAWIDVCGEIRMSMDGVYFEAAVLLAKKAEAAEREACGEIANKKAAEVLAKNTYRGRTSSAASFAASMLEDVGATIRMRSND